MKMKAARKAPAIGIAVALTLGFGACGGDGPGALTGGSNSSVEQQIEDNFGISLGDSGLDLEDLDLGDLDLGDLDLGDLNLDDLNFEELGLDLEDLDLENLDFEDLDLGDLEDLAESASSMSFGQGGGQVTVEGVTWTFDAQFCFLESGDLTVAGPGVGSDGSIAMVDITRTYDTREEMEEYLDPSFVDQMLNGEDAIESVSVSVTVGQEDFYTPAPDGLPEWEAESAYDINEINWEMDGKSITGSGNIQDDNAEEYGVEYPFTFQGSCS